MFEVRGLKDFERDTVLARTVTKAEAEAVAKSFKEAALSGDLFFSFDEIEVVELELFVSTVEEWSF